MVKRERLIRKLEEKGFVKVGDSKTGMLFRIPGTMQMVTIRHAELLPIEAVRAALAMIGEDVDCIESFIANN